MPQPAPLPLVITKAGAPCSHCSRVPSTSRCRCLGVGYCGEQCRALDSASHASNCERWVAEMAAAVAAAALCKA